MDKQQEDDRLRTIEYAARGVDPLAIDVTVEAEPPTLRLPPVEPDLGRRDSDAGVPAGAEVWIDASDLTEWVDEEGVGQ